jgi:Ion channel
MKHSGIGGPQRGAWKRLLVLLVIGAAVVPIGYGGDGPRGLVVALLAVPVGAALGGVAAGFAGGPGAGLVALSLGPLSLAPPVEGGGPSLAGALLGAGGWGLVVGGIVASLLALATSRRGRGRWADGGAAHARTLAALLVVSLAGDFAKVPTEARGAALAGTLTAGLGAALGMFAGVLAGQAFGARLRPGVAAFAEAAAYLRAMALPVVGFTLGYAFLVLWFAGCFAAVGRLDSAAFSSVSAGAPAPGRPFGDFLYLSIMTLSTLGYGDLQPASALARLLTSVEAVGGFAWTVIVFAAVLAYLQPRFDEVQRRRGR